MLFMILERFKNGDAVAVYQRFRDRGRLAPDGLSYVSSWVDTKLERCYQVMEAADPGLIDRWIANWADLVDCEVIPVITSAEAAAKIAGAEILDVKRGGRSRAASLSSRRPRARTRRRR